jgi:hypothetical protein
LIFLKPAHEVVIAMDRVNVKEPDELLLLKKNWVGNWDIRVERSVPSGETLHGTGTMLVEELSGGYALHALYRLALEKTEPHEEHELWGFDLEKRTIHMFCVTSRNSVVDLAGEWTDERTMTLAWKGISEGREVSRAFLFSWVSPDAIHATQKVLIDGKQGPATDFIMQRR